MDFQRPGSAFLMIGALLAMLISTRVTTHATPEVTLSFPVNGTTVTAFGRNDTRIGSSSFIVNVNSGPEISFKAPQSGATVSGITQVTMSTKTNVWWSNVYVDGLYRASAPPSTWNWDTTGYPNGSHVLSAKAYSLTNRLLGSASVTVTVANSSAGWSVTPGATIDGLTGSGANIAGADINPAHYGQYNAPGGDGDGIGLIGGPLLDDVQAASFVIATQKSSIETGVTGPANEAENSYFNYIASTNPSDYLYQLNASDGFYAAYAGSSWQAEVDRIDGACPLANPTTAEVLQWAANKWGINPLLLYAEATQDGNWDNTALGDDGCSSGVCQVADRNSSSHPQHAFPGFAGAGAMLARENTCFNADFFAAHLYAAFHGLTGECPAGDIGAAIQTWLVGYTFTAGDYTTELYNIITSQAWIWGYFNGVEVPL